MRSFVTFDHLPLVRFELAEGITDAEAARLLAERPTNTAQVVRDVELFHIVVIAITQQSDTILNPRAVRFAGNLTVCKNGSDSEEMQSAGGGLICCDSGRSSESGTSAQNDCERKVPASFKREILSNSPLL